MKQTAGVARAYRRSCRCSGGTSAGGLLKYLFFAAFAAVLSASAAANGGALIDLKAPVASWDDGIPLGNGGAGALVWGGGDTLNVTLDRADFWHNILPTRYSSPDFTWETLIDTAAKKTVTHVFVANPAAGSVPKLAK